MNDVRYVISEEDLALGPGTRLDGSLKSFCAAEFIKVTKGTERASDTDIRRLAECPPSLVLARELYTF